MVMYGVETKPSKLGAIYVTESPSDSMVVTKSGGAFFTLWIRARSKPELTPVTVRRVLRPGGLIRFSWALPLEELLGILRERQRHDFVASIFVSFAVIAVALAALGIFAIVNHTIAERKRELGVRIALGASARDILHAVLREGNVVALSGVAVGLLFTKYTAGWLHAFIFEDDEYNAPVFAAMAAILFIVAVVAALWPAFRATRIDPVESLRSE